MYRLILILSLYFIGATTWAQTCIPDPQYADSTAGVYPAPVTPANPDGGITQAACIGEYYEFTLTVIVPDSIVIDFNGFPVTLSIISAQITTEDAIDGLPDGIDYLCMPEDCTFPSGSSGCLLLYGTVDENASAGQYPLSIELDITLDGLGTQTFEYPGPQFPGSYDLTVLEASDTSCTSSTNQSFNKDIKLYPNPGYGDYLYVEGWPSQTRYSVYDLSGKIVQAGILQSARLPVHNISEGMYILRLETEDQKGQKKFVKLH